MSVGKNSIKRAAGKSTPKAEEKKTVALADECPKAAPELANSCSTPAKKTAKKPCARKSSPKKTEEKPLAKVPAVEEKTPDAKTSFSVTEQLPYYLL